MLHNSNVAFHTLTGVSSNLTMGLVDQKLVFNNTAFLLECRKLWLCVSVCCN